MLFGKDEPWLPARLGRYRLSAKAITALRKRGIPFLRRIERFSRPRLLPIDDRIASRGVAVIVLLLGIVLVPPFPFLNTLPALAVLIMGVGLLNRDGLFIAIGALLTATVIVVAGFQVGTLVALINRLLQRQP
jgi:hypothetical protein